MTPKARAIADAAFEKLGWPYDPEAVARNMAGHPEMASVRDDLQRGRGLARTGVDVARQLPAAARNVGRGVDRLLAPATGLGESTLKSLSSLGSMVRKSPALTRTALGATVLAPIMATSFHGSQAGYENEIMQMRRDPDRVVTASLDEFLEKKANAQSFLGAIGGDITKSFAGGVGGGIGQGLVSVLGNTLGGGLNALRDHFLTDTKRRRLIESVVTTDPVVRDVVGRNPNGMEMVYEAYGTMTRFAPTLALDINAVRSFLREALIGGAGVNYAVIKNLVDTERSISGGK